MIKNCEVCGKEDITGLGNEDYYILKGPLWFDVCNHYRVSGKSCVCVACAETALGESISTGHLIPCPANTDFHPRFSKLSYPSDSEYQLGFNSFRDGIEMNLYKNKFKELESII